MFTGIITDIAQITALQQNNNQDLLITLKLKTRQNFNRNLDIGSSISCNGVCLTLIKKIFQKDFFLLDFQASKETIDKTNLKNWQIDQNINIEFALRIGDELGGHLVSGHIDDVAKITNIKKNQESSIFTFKIAPIFKKFICQKASVVLNGVSLTVNDVFDNEFQVNIIDHTFNNTNFKELKIGDEVNLEIDQIARYLYQITIC